MSGELVTTGYAANSGIDEPAQVIPADRWRTLTPDLKSSGATSAGVAISGILVFKKRPLTPSSPRRSAATAHVRRWYKGWVDYNVKAGRQPSREDDERAAREALGSEVSRALLRQLRKELAPETWKRRGRPKIEG